MTERIKKISRIFRSVLASSLVLAVLFVVSCDSDGDDPVPELYDLTGVYTFQSASLETPLSITTPVGPITIPAGTPITGQLAGGLLAEAPCDDKANGAVELKSNNELFFACIGETLEAKAGTWAVNGDTTELSLNLASPPLPSALQLKLEQLEIDETNDVLSGSILNFPLTADLLAGFGVPNLPPQTVILVDVAIEFKKQAE